MVKAKTAFLALAAVLGALKLHIPSSSGFVFRKRPLTTSIAPSGRARSRAGGLVQLYINRAKAYNGVADQLVTKDGAPIPPAPGVIRLGSPLKFPTATVAISTLLPDFDQYAGPPIEFGRMEPTASDPSVQQQYGMTIGMPHAGQL